MTKSYEDLFGNLTNNKLVITLDSAKNNMAKFWVNQHV